MESGGLASLVTCQFWFEDTQSNCECCTNTSLCISQDLAQKIVTVTEFFTGGRKQRKVIIFSPTIQCYSNFLHLTVYFCKGNRTIADLRYGKKDIISPCTLIFALIRANLVHILSISPLRYCRSFIWYEAQMSVLGHVSSTWSEWIKKTFPPVQEMP